MPDLDLSLLTADDFDPAQFYIDPTTKKVRYLGALPQTVSFANGARRRNLVDKVQDYLSLADFDNLDPTGSIDCGAALQLAADYSASTGRPLHGSGIYRTSQAITFSADVGPGGGGIVGDSASVLTIRMASPTQDGVVFTGKTDGSAFYKGGVARNLTVDSLAGLDGQTAGAAFRLRKAQGTAIEECSTICHFNGIYMTDTALCRIEHNSMTFGSLPGAQIKMDGAAVNDFLFDNYTDNAGTHSPAYGLYISQNVNGTYIFDNSFSRCQRGLYVRPGANGKVQNLFFRSNAWDISGLFGAHFDATDAGAAIYRLKMLDEWFAATQAGPNLLLDGEIANVQFTSPHVRGGNRGGIVLSGQVRSAVITGMMNVGNSQGGPGTYYGVDVGPNVRDVQFIGGIVGAAAEEGSNLKAGFRFQAASPTNVSLVSVDLTSNLVGIEGGQPLITGPSGGGTTSAPSLGQTTPLGRGFEFGTGEGKIQSVALPGHGPTFYYLSDLIVLQGYDQTNWVSFGPNGMSLLLPHSILEIGSTSTAGAVTIDFHSSGSPRDYDARFVAYGGDGGSDGQGRVDFVGSTFGLAGAVLSFAGNALIQSIATATGPKQVFLDDQILIAGHDDKAWGRLDVGGLKLPGTNAGLEVGSTTDGTLSYIDMHSSGQGWDFDVRILSVAGGGSNGQGSLSIQAGAIDLKNVPVSDLRFNNYSVAQLAGISAQPGCVTYAADARKVGEAAGAGTGTMVYFSAGHWYRCSDDTIAAA